MLFFVIVKYIVQFIFGYWLEFFITNYWFFVCAGLIPAFIAKKDKFSFVFWWIAGTFFPIVSTIFALDCYEPNNSSTNLNTEPPAAGGVNIKTENSDPDSEVCSKAKEE